MKPVRREDIQLVPLGVDGLYTKYGKITVGQALINTQFMLPDAQRLFGPNWLLVLPALLALLQMAEALEDAGMIDLQECLDAAAADHAKQVHDGVSPHNPEFVPFNRN